MHLILAKYRREIIFFIDLMITFIVCSLIFITSEQNDMEHKSYYLLFPHLILLVACSSLTHFLFRTYDSLWRYADSKEYLSLLFGGGSGFLLYSLVDFYGFHFSVSKQYVLASYSISMLLMLAMRFLYRQYRKGIIRSKNNKIPIAIIGAGDAGARLTNEIKKDRNSKYYVHCFLDDSSEKIGKYIHDIRIMGPIENIKEILQETPVKEIILAIPSLTVDKRSEILERCTSVKCSIKILPSALAFIEEHKSPLSKSIREINIEEFLGREPVSFDESQVRSFISNKIVLVTGGGGSIGSELCRQIARMGPQKLIIIDIYENNAYDIQQELRHLYKDSLDLRIEIASVRDEQKINHLFERYQPNIVFHAAAHKHVPLMEACPEEAVKNNILGTFHVVMAADRYQVDKFVLISTDKAVNPTNIMGASKRFCEMILQSMKHISKTNYVAVRFGNVLGSNGSVIPLFQRQIQYGGPVTITDKRIIRYFMTIPEAAQLVLQAGSLANKSEIYVLDMGQPVKILDLAEKLIRLSGYEPYKDIEIIETGLRPGEKLYEELLMRSEELIATGNHKIFIERQKEISQSELQEKLDILFRALNGDSKLSLKWAMKLVVPTYREPEELNNVHINVDYSDLIKDEDEMSLVNAV